MKNNLFYHFNEAKNNDSKSIEYILQRFNPLILKYSNKLRNSEDSKSELTLHLLKTIHKIPLEQPNFKDDKFIIAYIKTSIKNHFCLLYSNQKKYDSIVDSCVHNQQIEQDNINSNLIFYDLIKVLNPKEKIILEKKFLYNYTNTEIANSLNLSRQNIQICIKRALIKLKKNIIT